MAADGTTGILAVSEYAQFTRAQPAGDDLNHFQSELRAGSILLVGCLTRLFLFRLSVAAGSQCRFLPFAIEADQDGQSPDLAGSEGKRDLQGEDNPAMAEGKDGPLLSRTERIVMHARSPDVASGLAREGVIDSTGQHLGAERQQKPEDAVAEIVEVPAGLAEEAVKGAEVF